MELMKNIEKATPLVVKDMVDYEDHKVVTRTLADTDGVGITVFAFDKDEGISTHAAGGDAFVTVLEGTGRFTIDGIPHELKAGESIVMPYRIPHAVYGVTKFKILLTVVFGEE